MSTPLTDAINALTAYANGITGKSDTNLPDAVRSLADGYGGGSGGLEYEEGTYIPETNGVPTIFFANQHNKAPSIIILNDISDTASSLSVTEAFVYINPVDLFGAPLIAKTDVYYDEYVSHLKKHVNGKVSSGTDKYTRGEVTSTSFIPFTFTSYNYTVGQTYKWIAIWK